MTSAESGRNGEPDPFAVFAPGLGRFLLVQLWAAIVGLAGTAVAIYFFATSNRSWFWFALAAVLVSVAVCTVFLKRFKSIVIGDTWMTGPTDGSLESTTILFDTLDPAATGIRKGRLTIQSISGREITTKTAWYAPEQLDEIKRLIRDRVSLSAAGGTLSW
jgi:hypothetical protein